MEKSLQSGDILSLSTASGLLKILLHVSSLTTVVKHVSGGVMVLDLLVLTHQTKI